MGRREHGGRTRPDQDLSYAAVMFSTTLGVSTLDLRDRLRNSFGRRGERRASSQVPRLPLSSVAAWMVLPRLNDRLGQCSGMTPEGG